MGGVDSETRTLVSPETFEKSAVPILIGALLLTIALGSQLFPLPQFDTDLSAFSPETPAQQAEERMSEYFPEESRPMFVHVSTDDGSNVLSMENLHLQEVALSEVMNRSKSSNDYIESVIAAPRVIQFAIDESDANDTTISDYTEWSQLLDVIIDNDTVCQDALGDDRALSAGAFIKDSLIHSDLDYTSTCDYLDERNSDPLNATGDASPTATSTLWVIIIDPSLNDTERQVQQNFIREKLDELSEDTALDYHSTSMDLMSHDINKSTIGELVLLMTGAILIVVLLLSIAFRSVRGVAFPLVGLSGALVWTYGGLALAGIQFSILEVAIAPVVLGLGIDYSIHLQRRYNTFRAEGIPASKAWLKGFETLKVALTLGVVTTIAAFVANIASPLPPLRHFGFGLAFGVFCAFISSTLVVGALHVVMERESSAFAKHLEWMRFGKFSEYMVGFQKVHQAKVIGIVTLLTVGSVIFAAANLETEFDLSDFLDDEMDVMEGRDNLYESYEAAGWKPIYILMEPTSESSSITDDRYFLESHRIFHHSFLPGTDGVVKPQSNPGNYHPAYDGPYSILFDAVQGNSSFGSEYNLRCIEGSNDDCLELATNDDYTTGEISAALKSLSANTSIADPLTGESWADRVNNVIAFNDDGSILYIRMEVLIEVKTSSDSEAVLASLRNTIDDFSGLSGMDQVVIHLTGDSVSLEAVLDGLTASQLQSTLISLAVCFTVLFALTRRIGPALIIVLPVGIASTWVVGSMAVLNVNWNVMTVMVTALTIGLGIDYSIHVWRRFEAMKIREGDVWSGLREMYASTGVALVLSAGTTICGFTILLLSQMPVVQDFGMVTAITVFFSLVLALVLLPVFLIMDSQSKNGSSSN
ncbi:MAG: MMPL family transporter [Candidatus Thermoplasmatota archaeon]|nr:MMPL family transporter [Candidatus Thermoplasmatota archaeon]